MFLKAYGNSAYTISKILQGGLSLGQLPFLVNIKANALGYMCYDNIFWFYILPHYITIFFPSSLITGCWTSLFVFSDLFINLTLSSFQQYGNFYTTWND